MGGRDCNTTIIHNHNYGPQEVQVDVLEILNSLGLPRFRDIQADTLIKGTKGTCLWLTTGEMFLIWVERGKILWGIGIRELFIAASLLVTLIALDQPELERPSLRECSLMLGGSCAQYV